MRSTSPGTFSVNLRRHRVVAIGLSAAALGLLNVPAEANARDEGKSGQSSKKRDKRWPDSVSLVSVFSPSPTVLDFPYQQAVLAFQRNVEAATGITVNVVWANEVTAAFPGGNAEVFEALKQGDTVQLTHGLPRLFVHDDARDQFKDIFENLPFGPNTDEFLAWIRFGGGQALYDEFYAPDGLLPFVGGNSGAQMGGWFAEQINDASQFAGLNVRIAGFASEVLNHFGANAFSTPVGMVNGLILDGTLDAAELCCPVTDVNFGVAATTMARGWIYHYPGWHEPTANAEFLFNARAFQHYSPELQEILTRAMAQAAEETNLGFDHKNSFHFKNMVAAGVQLHRFPDSLLEELRAVTESVVYDRLRNIPEFNYLSARILDSMVLYTQEMSNFTKLSEGAYYDTRDLPR